MIDSERVPFSIRSPVRALIEDIKAIEQEQPEGVTLLEISEEEQFPDPGLGLETAAAIVAVAGAISTIGGAVRFVDWVVQRVAEIRKSIEAKNEAIPKTILVIDSPKLRVRIEGQASPEEIRQMLRDVFGIANDARD